MKRVIFSGIQPSGNLHIGNYIGAISQWLKLQNSNENELIFSIVDLHAITVAQNPAILRQKILEVAALYLACGIDPRKSKIFIQSENPDHIYLAWIFDCILSMGELERMTQYKDKSSKIKVQSSNVTVGLFNYPALMAADILLYDTDLVPVGTDQTQHVELTRDVASRFNKKFGETFKIPKVMLDKNAARVMSLSNPTSKMSKSDSDPNGTINILESEDKIRDIIKRAVTDSGSDIVFREDKPALSNLLAIYSSLSAMPAGRQGREITDLENYYKGKNYSEFKKDLAQVVVSALKPIQEKYHEIRKDETYLNKVLDEGLKFARERSSKKNLQVKEAMGLGRK